MEIRDFRVNIVSSDLCIEWVEDDADLKFIVDLDDESKKTIRETLSKALEIMWKERV